MLPVCTVCCCKYATPSSSTPTNSTTVHDPSPCLKRHLPLLDGPSSPRTPPPPCASTAAVPKTQAKQRFNAHPVLRQSRACARGRGGTLHHHPTPLHSLPTHNTLSSMNSCAACCCRSALSVSSSRMLVYPDPNIHTAGPPLCKQHQHQASRRAVRDSVLGQCCACAQPVVQSESQACHMSHG